MQVFNQVNAGGQLMRDTSRDYVTGWTADGFKFDRCPDLSRGLAGLGELGKIALKLPPIGQKHVEAALQDPKTRPIVEECLKSSDPAECLTRQAESDIAEALEPTGKLIVFKEIAETLAPKIKAAQEAILAALPTKDTPEGKEALEIATMAEDPERALSIYYTEIALDEIVPGFIPEEGFGVEAFSDEDTAIDEIDQYGLGLSVKGKKILKGVGIAAGVAAAAVGGVLVAPAIGTALSTVGGALVKGVGSIFGKGAAPTPQDAGGGFPGSFGPGLPGGILPSPRPAIDWDTIANAAVRIYTIKKSNPAQAAQAQADLLRQLVAAGVPEGEASNLINQGISLASQRYIEREREREVTTMAPAPYYPPTFAPEVPTMPEERVAKAGMGIPTEYLILGGAAFFFLSQMMDKGGKRR